LVVFILYLSDCTNTVSTRVGKQEERLASANGAVERPMRNKNEDRI